MKMTLESLAAVLEDAERQSIERRAVQLWLKRLKNAMYDISDMVDEFEADTQPASRKISLKKLASIGPNNKLAHRMKMMREELKEITDQHKKFRLDVGSTTNEQRIPDTRETSSAMKDEELIVGRANEKRDIMASLSHSITGRITIFPIYGIGGIGKTTLAKMVFNDAHFRDYSHVWVYVSQTFDLNKIANSVISQLSKKESLLTQRQMIYTCLVEQLAGKNILIVLDDLWEDNGSLLDDLKDMLKVDGDKKIVVIVTTRNEGIANKVQTVQPYKLAPLSNDSCWIIIKQKSGFDYRCDKQQLEQIGKDIAMKCGGVALAAQSLGHMLQFLPSDEWVSVRNSSIWSVPASKNTNEVLSSLSLSYSYMHSNLKLCFAYCAIFPKGHRILKDNLIQQWNSLGFIEASDIFSIGQLGEKHIRKLLGLSFLQHSRAHNLATGVHHADVTYLTMHDLVHDLARLLLVDELILGVSKQGNTEGSSCRYALLDDCSKTLESYADSPVKIRALRFLDCGQIGLNEDAFSSAKFLRVLDLSECLIQRLPDSIGQLKQLRYLNAPGIQHQMIPKCITKLLKLIYLSLRGSSALLTLPDSIGELENLMYLDLSGCSGLEKLPDSFGNLIKLVHLDLSNCYNITGVSESLQNLTCLEYLNLSCCSSIGELSEHLGSLSKLKYFNLSGSGEIGELPRSFGNLKNLMHLDLSKCGQVKGIPEAMRSLTHLQYLNLSHCQCTGGTNMEEALGNLIQLRHLYLSGFLTCLCESTVCSFLECISTLSNLEHLDLSHNQNLHYVPHCVSSLSKLCTLDLSYCIKLVWLDPGLAKLDNLKMIHVNGCSPKLRDFLDFVGLNRSLIMLPDFEVQDGDDASSSNLILLVGVNPPELNLQGLDKVKSFEEAQRLKLDGKNGIRKLGFEWRGRYWKRVVEDDEVLEGLMPPSTIETLSIKGYSSARFPEWLMGIRPYSFPNLTSISLKDLENCIRLPPLGQLPNLKMLVLENMQCLVEIEEGFCGGAVAFPHLEAFTLNNMQRLEVWITMHSCLGGYMFPSLQKLNILSCPKLRLEPCPPKAQEYFIERSDGVISCWGASASYTGASTSSCPLVATLSIMDCMVPMHQWRLLCHLPALPNLEISYCSDLTSSLETIQALSTLQTLSVYGGNQAQLPELLGHLTHLENLTLDGFKEDVLQDAAKHLTLLQSLRLSQCESMTALPQWVRDLVSLQRLRISGCKNVSNLQEIMGCRTSLKKLDIRYCKSIEALPESIQQLTKLEELQISGCPALEQWCESEENKMKLAHIKVEVKEIDLGD